MADSPLRRVLACLAAAGVLFGAAVEAIATDRPGGHERVLAWRELMATVDSAGPGALDAVNRFFNSLDYASDTELWGVTDYWASPTELLMAGAGDCEDFAIAKYLTLREMGIPAERLSLRIAYARLSSANRIERHMVLLVRERDAVLVLDNLDPRILPPHERRDLALTGPPDLLAGFERRLSAFDARVRREREPPVAAVRPR